MDSPQWPTAHQRAGGVVPQSKMEAQNKRKQVMLKVWGLPPEFLVRVFLGRVKELESNILRRW